MWNLSEIKKKQKYVLNRLKNNISNEEKEKLELSLISFISILNFVNFMSFFIFKYKTLKYNY